MRLLRILGVLFILVGIAALGGSMYISNQVAEGEVKIKKAESAVDKGNALFSLSPVTKELGQSITDSAGKKIEAGKQQIAQYTELAGQLKIGGIILIVIGAGLFLIRPKKRR
jgi:hypothetical protein